jgi:hypothetical protein
MLHIRPISTSPATSVVLNLWNQLSLPGARQVGKHEKRTSAAQTKFNIVQLRKALPALILNLKPFRLCENFRSQGNTYADYHLLACKDVQFVRQV